MSQQNESGILSVVAGAARAAFLRVYNNSGTWTTAGAANQADGVQQEVSLAGTDIVPIKITNAQGTRKMVADGVIAAGAAVYAGATGYVSGAGSIIEGRALEAATTADQVIEVLPLHNADVPSTAGVATPTVTFNGLTGANEIRLTANLADALSVEDTTGDIITIATTTGAITVAFAQLVTFASTATHSGDVIIVNGVDLALGTTSDVLLRFSAADASDPCLVLALDDTSQQMHITDKAAVATDWNRVAGTHPELAIHSNTTPITDYLAIGNHDGTSASIDVVGGTTFNVKIAGTTEFIVTAALTTIPGMLYSPESVANTAGVGITGTAAYFVTSVEKIGTIIKTTILIDLAGLNSGGTADDIIGADGAGVAHLGQITAAVNGTIIGGRMTCLETPTTGDNDIDLWYANEATGVEDTLITALTGEIQITDGGDITAGTVRSVIPPPADKYLYLVAHTGDADATYSTGILLIELFGKAA